jgi:hypothetical protein
MAFFDTIDNMEFNRDTPVVRGEQFLPSIYIFSLGKVKELRESLSITNEYDDDFVVAKYGYTKDFTNTTETLREKYEHIDNVDIQLLHHYYVDQKQIFKAEKEIRDRFVYYHYQPYNLGEFIIIPTFMNDTIQHIYRVISQKHTGKNAFIMNKMNDLMREHEIVLQREIAEFVSQLALKNAELKQKDSEIDIIKRDTTIELNLLKAEIDKRDSTIEQNLLKTELENNVLKAVIENNMLKSELENNVLKAENKGLKTEMKMMALEQQLIEKNRIIENMNK